MDMNAIQAALAQGQQQQQAVVAAGCGLPWGAGYGGFGGGLCGLPGLVNPSPTPQAPGFINGGGLVASIKVMGAFGIIDCDGHIYTKIACLPLNTGTVFTLQGSAFTVTTTAPAFFPVVEELTDDGTFTVTIEDGYGTICGWKWTDTDGVTVISAAARKAFVTTVINAPADTFNIDGCQCPINLVCVTEDDPLDIKVGFKGDNEILAVVRENGVDTNTVINGAEFAFALYVQVIEVVGNCGDARPFYNLIPAGVPILPPPAGVGPCPPGMLMGAPGGMPAGMQGLPGNGYMQPGQQQ